MSPWKLLGVEPGSDRKVIKKAYTRLIKDVHPEDNPDEFMRLRQAYESVLASLDAPSTPKVFSTPKPTQKEERLDLSAWDSADHENTDSSNSSGQARTIEDDRAFDQNDPKDTRGVMDVAEDPDRRNRQLNEVKSAMLHVMDNPDLRNHYVNWKPLLEGRELNDFQVASDVGRWLLEQIVYRLGTGGEHCPFKPELLSRLNERFQWTSDYSNMPIAERDALPFSLLIEAADQETATSENRAGWDWLSNALFSLSGRLSRIECLLGLAAVFGAMLLLFAMSLVLPKSDTVDAFAITAALVAFYCLTSLLVKRVRDINVNPAVAILLGLIFPAVWILFLLGAPRDNEKDEDPRLKFTPVFELAYREYYASHHDRPLKARLTERLAGIHPDVYWSIAAIWIAGFCLLMI